MESISANDIICGVITLSPAVIWIGKILIYDQLVLWNFRKTANSLIEDVQPNQIVQLNGKIAELDKPFRSPFYKKVVLLIG